jgi:hypothetical protein
LAIQLSTPAMLHPGWPMCKWLVLLLLLLLLLQSA